VNRLTGFSSFNYFKERVTDTLSNSGSASVRGLDLSYERSRNGFYSILSGSIYHSQYLVDKSWQSARFNTGYNLSVTTGKEFKLRSGLEFMSADLRGVHRNGFLSSDGNSPNTYNARLPVYARLDLRISYRRNKKTTTTIWALDIQNVSNRKNTAYFYFDRVTNQYEARYQLGLIPVLSYKLLF
jgi:outer membrane receptor protein involved in Fe transport